MTEQKQVVGRNPKLITERLFPDDTISRYQQGACERFFWYRLCRQPQTPAVLLRPYSNSPNTKRYNQDQGNTQRSA